MVGISLNKCYIIVNSMYFMGVDNSYLYYS